MNRRLHRDIVVAKLDRALAELRHITSACEDDNDGSITTPDAERCQQALDYTEKAIDELMHMEFK